MKPEIIVSLIAIAAVLFSVIASHRLSVWRNKRDIIRQAAHRYKLVFAKEIASINHSGRVNHITDNVFKRHMGAVNVITPILPVSYQRKLQKACGSYQHHGNDADIGSTEEEVINAVWELVYMGINTTTDETGILEPFENLHSCLDDLL